MCRTGGRRCPGSNGKAKATLRQRIHRARRAITAAHAAGDLAAAVAGEIKLAAAAQALAALKSTHDNPAHTTEDTMPDSDKRDSAADEAGDVTGNSYGGRVGNITGNGNVTIVDSTGPIHIGRGMQVNCGTVINTNHGGNVGMQAGLIVGGVTIGHSSGPVHTGDGVQINGGSWDSVSRENSAAYQAAMDAARAARQHAKQARQQAKADRQRARQNQGGNGNVVISSNTGGVMTGNGYTVVGGNVYRHPGRSVSVNGNVVTDAVTGEQLEPTRSVPNTGQGHSVVSSNGVLYVNGERID